MSSIEGKEINGGSSVGKQARQRRLSFVREKKKNRYQENTGQLLDNGLESKFQNQRHFSCSSFINPLRSMENDIGSSVNNASIGAQVDTLFVEGEKQGYLDFGSMDYCCQNCGALVWFEERAEKYKTSHDIAFSICCMKGKIKLPYLSRPPLLLWNLIHGLDSKSEHFLENIRSYNSMFAFTSLGEKVKFGVNSGHRPPQFILRGQNYHRIRSLLPPDGQAPKFAQLYIYDTQNEVLN